MREYFDEIIECGEAIKERRATGKLLFFDESCQVKTTLLEDGKAYFLEISKDVLFNESAFSNIVDLGCSVLKKCLANLGVKKGELILAVGIGNEGLTADSLGVKTVEKLKVTKGEGRKNGGNLCAFCPSVSGVTGIESVEIIKALTERLQPRVVLCVDTLSCKDVKRLASVVQFKEGSLTPGAGVGNVKPTLNQAFLGVPVIGMGVPLVMLAKNILIEYLIKSGSEKIDFKSVNGLIGDLVVTPKEVDAYVERFSFVIAESINRAVHGKF